MDVFHKCEDLLFGRGHLGDQGGDGLESGEFRRTEPPLSRDQFIPLILSADDNRLQHADFTYGVGKLREFVRIEMLAGLPGIRKNRSDRNMRKLRFLRNSVILKEVHHA